MAMAKDPGAEMEVLPGTPFDDLQLNVFLNTLAKEITDEDFEQLKFLCSGNGGLSKKVLEEIRTRLEFFICLKERLYLNRYNLMHLQSLLWHIGRKDLFQTMADFAQGLNNMLHLFTPKPQPENGFKYIKFHVRGEGKDCTRANLERLKTTISLWMCVPPNFVYIAGIEPSGSIVFTFMVPEVNLEFLTDLGIEARTVLREFSVDGIDIDGTFYSITEGVTPSESMLMKELRELHEKNMFLNKSTEELEKQTISLRRENATLKSVPKPMHSFSLPLLMNIVYELHKLQKRPGSFVRPNLFLESLRQKSARTYYLAMLKKMRNECYNHVLIKKLLEAHTMVTMDTFHEQQLVRVKALDYVVLDLQLRVTNLQREKEELLPPLQMPEVTIKLRMKHVVESDLVHALAKASRELLPKDRSNLLKDMTWAAEEKDIFTKNHDQSLMMVFMKKFEEIKDPISSLTLLFETLERIDRKDLVPKIEEYIKEFQANGSDTDRGKSHRNTERSLGMQREKSRNKIGEDLQKKNRRSKKNRNEPNMSDIDFIDVKSMIREMYDMFKSVRDKQPPLIGHSKHNGFGSMLPGATDQSPYAKLYPSW